MLVKQRSSNSLLVERALGADKHRAAWEEKLHAQFIHSSASILGLLLGQMSFFPPWLIYIDNKICLAFGFPHLPTYHSFVCSQTNEFEFKIHSQPAFFCLMTYVCETVRQYFISTFLWFNYSHNKPQMLLWTFWVDVNGWQGRTEFWLGFSWVEL